MIVHAGLIARFTPAGWRGVLIEGPSGSGKSDLALRALEAGFRLVADDRTVLWACAGRLYGRAPASLAGLIEVRGLQVMAEPALAFCRVSLVVRCGGRIERMPEPEQAIYAGVAAPVVALAALEASAPAKMRRALDDLGAEPEGAYQAGRAAGPSQPRHRGSR